MKRRNLTNKIMQQGGLMIEALAMLGLIAVVTPTMYKKSAERTMEVEDINTATTVRTVMGAAESYIAANYATITSDMIKNNEDVREIPIRNLDNYLPYKFNTAQALYNYDEPKVALVRQDNNLTAFVLFPAKNGEDAGIGQERTARIAALVGSNGGYVNGNKSARGVGGIWSLNTTNFTKTFPGQNPNMYSLVTASADTISASAGNEIDNDKYLQRGRDDEDGDDNLWKNTMRTDLYMGRAYQEGDEADMYRDAPGPFSIRNINSLIVGAEKSALGAADADGNQAETGNYGLYISPDATNRNKNAFIAENLEAAASNFKATKNLLGFGNRQTGTDVDGNPTDEFSFTVANNGNTKTKGTLTVDSNVYLANEYGWRDVKIGRIVDLHPTVAPEDQDDFAIKVKSSAGGQSDHNYAPYGRVTLFDDKIMQVNNFGNNDTEAPAEDRIVLMDGGLKRVSGEEYSGSENAPTISYANDYEAPIFPVRIGSNTKVEGVLAAAQLDAQKLRAATLSVGSENIDDTNKWLNVDKDGVTIKDPAYTIDEDASSGSAGRSGTRLRVADDIIAMKVGDATELENPSGNNKSSHSEQVVLRQNEGTQVFGTKLDLRGEKAATMTGRGVLVQALSEKNSDNTYKSLYDKMNEPNAVNEVKENTVMLRNNDMQMRMNDRELRISGRTINPDGDTSAGDTVLSEKKNYRTVFSGGNLDLDNTNFNVQALRPVDKSGTSNSAYIGGNGKLKQSILSIYGNDYYEDERYYKYASGDSKAIFKDNDTYLGSKYDLAMHGNILITDGLGGQKAAGASASDISQSTQYVSLSTNFNAAAGINIMARNSKTKEEDRGYDDTAKKNVILIDQGALKTVPVSGDGGTSDGSSTSSSSSSPSSSSSTVNGSNSSNNYDKAQSGTIYIRKGYLEVKPKSVANYDKESNPLNGFGVIAASRLVANNPPKSSSYGTPGYEVPDLFTKDVRKLYNKGMTGDSVSVNAYDRYMVNPAYTSVMHDIKLVTRGGARLSDILPDFITKGIYVVTNGCSESMPFPPNLDDVTRYYSDNCKPQSAGTRPSLGKPEAWGSPVLGFVPAPQCPPGYGRVITLTPATFQMAQAGAIAKSGGDKGSYYVIPAGVGNSEGAYVDDTKKDEKPIWGTEFKKVEVAGDTDTTKNKYAKVNISGGAVSSPTNFTVNGMENIGTTSYVLKADSDKMATPMYIQQSTWLKSLTLPLQRTSRAPVSGWAAIMGFLYPSNMYENLAKSAKGKLSLDDSSETTYWNLFPVMRDSMEGYATVYCYFDRTNINANDFNDTANEYINTIDNFTPTIDKYVSFSYKKKVDDAYKNRLNDPTLYYDEVW